MSVTRLNLVSSFKNGRQKQDAVWGEHTVGNPKNIALDGGPDPPPHSEGEGESMQPSRNYFGLLFRLRFLVFKRTIYQGFTGSYLCGRC